MKKLSLLSIISFGLFVFSFCEAKEYHYQSINVDITINDNSTFDVAEQETYYLNDNFGFFYRDIELKRLDHISNIEVFDGDGNKLDESVYKITDKGGIINIKWDFPRRDFNEELKSWTIKYTVHGGLGFYKEYDEIYWNAVGRDREKPVSNAEVIVHLPGEISKDNIETILFVGVSGNQNKIQTHEMVDSKTVRFWASDIQPGQYLTIVTTWPKGFVSKPLFYKNQLIDLISILIALFIPIIVFLKAFSVWREKGRDPKMNKTIIAHYSPPDDLPPSLVDVLIDQRIDVKGITATVIDLAVRGYLKIRERENKFLIFKSKEYIFEKTKDEMDLKPFEQKIMRAVFRTGSVVSMNDLKNRFYLEIPKINKEVHRELSKTGHFTANIQETRKKHSKKYIILLVIFFILIIAASIIAPNFLGQRYLIDIIIIGVGMVIGAVIGLAFAQIMPALTKQGLEAKWKALGFKEYLHTAERFRIEAETLDTFSKFLPYAMIFGVEKQWANRFSDFSYKDQTWFVPLYAGHMGQVGGAMSMSNFTSSFSGFATSMSQTFSSSPGGSGAGGAGGAGGGGGGGGGGAG